MSQHSSTGWTRARWRAGLSGCTQTPHCFSKSSIFPAGLLSLGNPTALHMPCCAGKASAAAMGSGGCIPCCIAWEQSLCGCWIRICLHWHSSLGPAERLEGVTVQPQTSLCSTVRAEAVSSSEKNPLLTSQSVFLCDSFSV